MPLENLIPYRQSPYTYREAELMRISDAREVANAGDAPIFTRTCLTCAGYGYAFFKNERDLLRCPRCDGMGRITQIGF